MFSCGLWCSFFVFILPHIACFRYCFLFLLQQHLTWGLSLNRSILMVHVSSSPCMDYIFCYCRFYNRNNNGNNTTIFIIIKIMMHTIKNKTSRMKKQIYNKGISSPPPSDRNQFVHENMGWGLVSAGENLLSQTGDSTARQSIVSICPGTTWTKNTCDHLSQLFCGGYRWRPRTSI